MVAPLCWEPDLKAVKTAESGFEMDSPRIAATLDSIKLIELPDSQAESDQGMASVHLPLPVTADFPAWVGYKRSLSSPTGGRGSGFDLFAQSH
jgi:hypothetical protein